MFHRSMYLGRFYKSTLRLASSQNLIKATADVILFPQIWRNFSNIASISIDIFRGDHYVLGVSACTVSRWASNTAKRAGSSSVPAHVEMMGFLGIGNNPMVGCSVACAVNVDLALNKK